MLLKDIGAALGGHPPTRSSRGAGGSGVREIAKRSFSLPSRCRARPTRDWSVEKATSTQQGKDGQRYLL